MSDRVKVLIYINKMRNWAGGREYFENLIYALGRLSSQNQWLELCAFSDDGLSPDIQQFISKVYTDKNLHPVTLSDRIKWKLNEIASMDKKPFIDNFLKKEKIDFVYPYFSSDKRPKPYRSAAWIPDFQHKHLPEFFKASELKSRDEEYSKLVSNADKVILSSEMARGDCHRFFPDAIKKTCVMQFRTVPQAEWYEVNPSDTQLKYNLPDKFLIVSNHFWQHKNHLLIFSALQLLKQQSIFPMIVCTGHMYDHRNPEYLDKVLSAIHELGISKQVVFLGHIPKIDQIQLIRRSIAVIQPSLFEGWSTIVENARCFGKPMILSDFPVHIEQNVPDNLIFERSSVSQLAECILNYWQSLSPGPDIEKEKISLNRQQEHIKNFGRKFLEIIQQ